MSDSYTSSSYYYSSTTNTTDGSTTTGHRYTTTSHTDPDGNTIVRTATQDLGAPAIIEERRYDRTGQEQLLPAAAGMSSAGGVKRITDLDEEGETGATTHDPGTVYGPGSTASALDEGGGGESVADVTQAGGGGEELGRITYDSGPAFGGRTYDPSTGAYDESVVMDSDGVVQQRARERHHHRVRGRYHGAGDSSGYYATEAGGSGRRVVGFENPGTGAILRRESDVDISDVI
jgi:hypothetical protein